VVTAAFQAQLTGIDRGDNVLWTDPQVAVTLNNVARLYWNNQNQGIYTPTLPTQTLSSNVNSYVGQPLLHINKTYVTPDNCNATLLEDTFNRASTPTNRLDRPNYGRLEYRSHCRLRSQHQCGSRHRYFGACSLSDFSYSAMCVLPITRPAGLVFRYVDTNNYYRLFCTIMTRLEPPIFAWRESLAV